MEAAAVAALGPLLGGASAPGSVSLAVSSSLNVFRAQKRYSTGLTIAELKVPGGTGAGPPRRYRAREPARGDRGSDQCELEPVMGIPVTDRSGSHVGVFEDVSQVPKYEIPDSEYDKRPAPPSCHHHVTPPQDKPTSSRDIGWACATMSPWASTMEAWAGRRGTSSASPSTEPSSNPRASPPGDFPEEDDGLEDEM
ncbi:hypothetical protein Q9233_017521 [Columba guinea]|nr:hypothetical protein Q9233_017521 [Columba guinea]